MRAEKTHCPQASGQHQKPTLVGVQLSPVSQSFLLFLAFWFASFQSSTFLTSLIHIPHLQVPFTPKAALTNISKCYSLLPHHLSHLNKCFCESATVKGVSSLLPLTLQSNHWPCTLFIPNQCSSLRQSHPYWWSFSCRCPPTLCSCWEKDCGLWAEQGPSATPSIQQVIAGSAQAQPASKTNQKLPQPTEEEARVIT